MPKTPDNLEPPAQSPTDSVARAVLKGDSWHDEPSGAVDWEAVRKRIQHSTEHTVGVAMSPTQFRGWLERLVVQEPE